MNAPYLKPAEWGAEVNKMIKVTGGPIDPAEAKAIPVCLKANYGG